MIEIGCLVLTVSVAILAITVFVQSRQIKNLTDLLDRMDIALAKQHEVIDNQQTLIDDVAHHLENLKKE